jgi:hypothetical protein
VIGCKTSLIDCLAQFKKIYESNLFGDSKIHDKPILNRTKKELESTKID